VGQNGQGRQVSTVSISFSDASESDTRQPDATPPEPPLSPQPGGGGIFAFGDGKVVDFVLARTTLELYNAEQLSMVVEDNGFDDEFWQSVFKDISKVVAKLTRGEGNTHRLAAICVELTSYLQAVKARLMARSNTLRHVKVREFEANEVRHIIDAAARVALTEKTMALTEKTTDSFTEVLLVSCSRLLKEMHSASAADDLVSFLHHSSQLDRVLWLFNQLVLKRIKGKRGVRESGDDNAKSARSIPTVTSGVDW
jgi:hypothetical protein